jgi:hypothetical protein
MDKVKKKKWEIGYKSVIDFGWDPTCLLPTYDRRVPTKIFPGTPLS